MDNNELNNVENNVGNNSTLVSNEPEVLEPVQSVVEPSVVPSDVQPVQNVIEPSVAPTDPQPVQNAAEPVLRVVEDKPKKEKSIKKPIIFIAIIALVLGLGFLAVTVIGGIKGGNSRTIMIYMVGANLESEAQLGTVDLNGLDYDKLKSNNTNVILIAGGAKKWNNDYIDSGTTSLYELTDSGFKLVKKQDLTNMGLSSTLTSFLDYGYKNYKADKYDLIFWNHGSAILGAENDELFKGDYLTPTEISSALAKSPFSNKKLELVLFRTCLNGTLEIADTFKDYSNYLVASEEVTRGYIAGGSVLKIFNDISVKDSGVDIGKKFVDNYMEYIDNFVELNHAPKSSIYSTYAVIDLAKINDLEKSLNNFVSDINISKNYNSIARVRNNLKQYGNAKYFDTVDLYNLVDGIKSVSSSKAKKVLDDLEKAVVYYKASDSKSRGLSIYFPFKGSKDEKTYILNNYYNYSSLDGYKKFIQSFNAIQTGGVKSFSLEGNTTTIKENNNKSDFELVLTDEQKAKFAGANYIVFKDNKDGTYRPLYNGNVAKLDGNSVKISLKNKLVKAYDSTNPSKSVIVNVIENDEDDKYITYEVRPILEYLPSIDNTKTDVKDQIDDFVNGWKWYHCKMSLVYDKSKKKMSIGGVAIKPENLYNKQANEKTEDFSEYNVMVDLKDYTHVGFGGVSYKITDENNDYTDNWTNNQSWNGYEIPTSNIAFEYEDFSATDDYYAVFQVWDIYNNSYISKLVKIGR